MATKTWSFGRSFLFIGVALTAAVLVYQLVGCMSAPAQERSTRVVGAGVSVLPSTADELIGQMALSAAIIFAGEVVAVRHPVGVAGSPEDAAEGIVSIDFRVDQAVLGVQANSIYTLREWSGLWTGGSDRYRVGQRLLMLLRAPNAAGLTSPVHGFEGAIPLRGLGPAPGPYESASAASQWMVDIRWLQSQIQKQQLRTPAPLRGPIPVRGGGGVHSEAAASASEGVEPLLVHALPGPWIEQTDVASQGEALSHVLAICALAEAQHVQ